ncbi:MAG: hypothetical protein ACD_29C00461G0005 [uncultured bacterium]|nr:MAG: hypothetical protein ACD_29C00461G0005 [uncultured bacterium]
MKEKNLAIRQPDDFHCHFRDHAFLVRTVHDSAKQFARAIAMPNLKSPIASITMAADYQNRIIQAIPANLNFKPLMTLYLSESISPDLISEAKKSGIIFAAKLYPAGVTTNSDFGISNLKHIYNLFEQMEECDLPLCVHGESIDKTTDIFDREKLFLSENLAPLLKNFPKLRIILEHISTKEAVEFVKSSSKNLSATITPHHLHYNRNDLLYGGVRPHYFCMPILKRESDRQALIQAVISGNPKFFLGTDSAPHEKNKKESACGCAGIYSTYNALALYAEIFEQCDALDKLENFASVYGAEFYQLDLNKQEVVLMKKSEKIPNNLSFGDTVVVPMKAGENISWQII